MNTVQFSVTEAAVGCKAVCTPLLQGIISDVICQNRIYSKQIKLASTSRLVSIGLPIIRPMKRQLIARAITRVRSFNVDVRAIMANTAAPAPVPIPVKESISKHVPAQRICVNTYTMLGTGIHETLCVQCL